MHCFKHASQTNKLLSLNLAALPSYFCCPEHRFHFVFVEQISNFILWSWQIGSAQTQKSAPIPIPDHYRELIAHLFFFYCEQTALFSDSLHWIGLIGAKVWDCFLGINNKPCFSCISALTAAIQLKQVFISCQSVVRHANTKENVDYFCIQYITSDGQYFKIPMFAVISMLC